MKLRDQVLATINKYDLIKNGDRVVLGLSGGPDSLCLLNVLVNLNKDYIVSEGRNGLRTEIYPVHVNHMFRGEEADEDQAFCERFTNEMASKFDFVKPVRCFKVNCREIAETYHLTSEEAGRLVRYQSFSKVYDEVRGYRNPDTVIAVAQNADDQAETVLFRILRGTGTDGLTGISYSRLDDGGRKIVRPLLNSRRVDIENYCKFLELNPRIDKTNGENIYTRNKIRNELLPFLREKFNPNITETLVRLAAISAADRSYMTGEAEKVYSNCRKLSREANYPENTRVVLDISRLSDLHPAIRIRVYGMALYEAGMKDNVTQKFLDAIDRIRLSQNHPMAYTELTGGYRVARLKGDLVFYFTKQETQDNSNTSKGE